MSSNASDSDLDMANGTTNAWNATSNGTEQADSVWQALHNMGYLLLEAKLVLGAMGIIYVGAHAALRRPPSAASSKKKKPGQKHEDEEESFVQGLELSDAIWFPISAATVLIGLYYLIKWLKDPAILNKVLQWYVSTMSIASMLSLYSHGIDVVASFVFPKYWRGLEGRLRKAEQKSNTVVVCDDAGNNIAPSDGASGPLPGPLAILNRVEAIKMRAWDLRDFLTRHWVIRLKQDEGGEEKINVKASHLIGFAMAIGTAVVYFTTKSTFVSNVLGYAMCYGAFLLLSPTDFLTAACVLVGLFFYDIVMVFYTPYMITVATTLEVPIKLSFKQAGRSSILGLGDIVLPGMFIAWTLRLDLWRHYAKKIKHEPTDLKMITKDETSGEVVHRSETKHLEIKARYVEATGSWGDRFWIRGPLFFKQPRVVPKDLTGASFPKVYFYASMVGYLLGMLVTLTMVLVFKKGQPALLYLVPGVLGSVVLCSVARGEFQDLWQYTEDGSLDTKDLVVDLDGSGKPVKEVGKLKIEVVDTTKGKEVEDKELNTKDEKKVEQAKAKRVKGYQVFSFTIEVPAEDAEE